LTQFGGKPSKKMEEKKTISNAEKRWIVREIESGRMSVGEARERFALISKDTKSLINSWRKKFVPEISFTLPIMTEKERQKLDAAQKRIKELEKQLENAQMKNISLETMIDIAEEQLKISIRKKSGPKQ
jgi:transposase-like protein